MSKSAEEPILVNKYVYYLNKSKSKFVLIGLSPSYQHRDLIPKVIIGGVKGQWVDFELQEWFEFLDCRKEFDGYMSQAVANHTLKRINNYSLMFTEINKLNVLKIFKDETMVYLAQDTLQTLWDYSTIITQRMKTFVHQHFNEYYRDLLIRANDMQGDVLRNVEILMEQRFETDFNCCIEEMMKLCPGIVQHHSKNLNYHP